MPYRPRDERYVDWPGVQKDVGHLVACVVGGEHEWGHTKIIGNVDVGPRTDQQPRRGDIVPVNGPRDGRRAIGLRATLDHRGGGTLDHLAAGRSS